MAIRGLLIVVGLLLVAAWASLFTVNETQRAVVEEFGKVVVSDVKPGIHTKLPWQDVKYFEARNMVLDTPPTQFLTRDSEYLDVDSYVIWRIDNVQRFYTAARGGNLSVARDLLGSRVRDGLKNAVSERTLIEVVFGEREELMATLTQDLNKVVQDELGIRVIDVRTKRIDYPRDAREAVFNRMRTDRQQEASRIRAEGREQSEKIRADADRQEQELLAAAYRDAQITRGEGDKTAARTYSDAYNRDPEFYAFYRSLKAYRTSFSGSGDVMVLEPKSEFFKYLKDSRGSK